MNAQLESMGLLRQFRGRWQYRIQPRGVWMTANSEAGVLASAQAAFDALPESERLTTVERAALADAAHDAKNAATYGDKTPTELLAMLARLTVLIGQHQHSARREFNGGGRRTGPAVSAEAARSLGVEKLRLSGYIDRRAA